jgi:Tfp pilus assembly protein PilX
MMPDGKGRRGDNGSVLIISLIMLMVLTLLAISAINMSSTGLKIVNAMQARREALSAAQQCVERLLGGNFAANIATVAGTCTVAIDAGKSYNVTLGTPCLKQMQAIRNTDLKLSDPEDVKCFDTTTNPWSACANTVWDFSSAVNEGFFGANVSLRQGIALRMDNASAIAYSTSLSPVYACP